MQLQEMYKKEIHAVSLNIEYSGDDQMPPAELQDEVRSMLGRRGITCENIMCTANITDTMDELGVAGLPAVLVFDKEGELSRRFDGGFSYEKDVFPLVAELVSH